jgi:hypothetical protein
MEAAQKSAAIRDKACKRWAESPEVYAGRRRKSPRHGISTAEYVALMAVARIRAAELIEKLLKDE